MLKKRLTKIAALCIASTLLLAGCSSGSTKSSPNPDSEKDSAAAAPIVLKFSDVNAEQSPAGIFCLKFKELVEERTEGRVQIENYFGGTLTANNIEGTQTGIADLSQHDVSEVTDLCAALSILEAPFLFDSEEELFKVTAPESPIMDRLNEELSGTGVRLLATYSWGNQNLLTTSKPVYCEEDLKGMKIRVIPSQIFMETMSAMGATPSPMGWSEVVTSLITKMIDGTGMPFSNIVDTGLHEIEGYCIMTGHNPTLSGVFINEASWNKLSEDDQKILEQAGVEARQAVYESFAANEEAARAAIAEKGMVIIENDELSFDTDAIRDSVAEKFKDDWGDIFQEIMEYLGKA